jgi:serine/threonine protein kinase
MLAGETPFKASNTPAMLVKHVSEAPRPLLSLRPDAPPALAHAIARALAKKPEDRWPDAAAFRDALSGAAPSPAFEDRTRPRFRDDAGSRHGVPGAGAPSHAASGPRRAVRN